MQQAVMFFKVKFSPYLNSNIGSVLICYIRQTVMQGAYTIDLA